MKHPKTYLLEKIINEGEKFKTLGELNGKHVDDISNVMAVFTEETVGEVLERLANGEVIRINGKAYTGALAGN